MANIETYDTISEKLALQAITTGNIDNGFVDEALKNADKMTAYIIKQATAGGAE